MNPQDCPTAQRGQAFMSVGDCWLLLPTHALPASSLGPFTAVGFTVFPESTTHSAGAPALYFTATPGATLSLFHLHPSFGLSKLCHFLLLCFLDNDAEGTACYASRV